MVFFKGVIIWLLAMPFSMALLYIVMYSTKPRTLMLLQSVCKTTRGKEGSLCSRETPHLLERQNPQAYTSSSAGRLRPPALNKTKQLESP